MDAVELPPQRFERRRQNVVHSNRLCNQTLNLTKYRAMLIRAVERACRFDFSNDQTCIDQLPDLALHRTKALACQARAQGGRAAHATSKCESRALIE
jgi:hypothetical protein